MAKDGTSKQQGTQKRTVPAKKKAANAKQPAPKKPVAALAKAKDATTAKPVKKQAKAKSANTTPPPAKEKTRKAKLVRDSFAMPESEYKLIGDVKRDCLHAGIEVKKSELLR